jgi:hypothetical protein
MILPSAKRKRKMKNHFIYQQVRQMQISTICKIAASQAQTT